MKSIPSMSADKQNSTSIKYAKQTYDYLKYLLGRKDRKYGTQAALGYSKNPNYFCNED